MARWTRFWEFKKRRRAKYDEESIAGPVNTRPPSFNDGGGGLLIADRGTWSNYPTKFAVIWKVGGNIVQYGDTYPMPSGTNIASVTLTVTASNDNGSNSITVP